MSTHYDLAILGGGPAGYLAAERAARGGMRVLLAEKNALGGVCLNEGCIPSKAFLSSAKRLEYARDSKRFGVGEAHVDYDQRMVVRRKNKVVKRLVAGVRQQLDATGAELISGEMQIEDFSSSVFRLRVGECEFRSERLLLASGSEAIQPPITGLREAMEAGWLLGNREILDLEQIPERLSVIGGGVIGLEMASYFRSCGAEVHVYEMLDHIAGTTDRELSAALRSAYETMGICFHLETKVLSLADKRLRYLDKDGREESAETDYCLLAAGRRAFLRGFGLDKLPLAHPLARVETDDHMRCPDVPGLYAAGDVTGSWMLAHVAYREAEVAVNHMLGRPDRMSYRAVPSVIYGMPEAASCGLSEEELRSMGRAYLAVKLPLSYSGRFQAETEREPSFCKLLFDRRGDDAKLLGLQLMAPYASEIILSAAILIESEMPLAEMKKIIFPHPGIAEVIREAFYQL